MKNRNAHIAILIATLLASAAVRAQGAVHWESLPTAAPAPADNPTTPAKIRLGKMLFFDPRLSSTGTVSCFSCHNIMEGGDDHRPVSIGVEAQRGGRNAPTVFNAAFLSVQFWDGRAATLEAQDKGPPVNPIEMGMKGLTEVIYRIKLIPGYRPYFEQAFGSGDVVTMDNASRRSPPMSARSSPPAAPTTGMSRETTPRSRPSRFEGRIPSPRSVVGAATRDPTSADRRCRSGKGSS
jgi:cytochrome c peroxidase